MTAQEVNFDGLIGPTHHYGGLSLGNLASLHHRHKKSSPRRAALQGLAKMKHVADLGVPQAILPPQRRPDLAFLARHGLLGVASAYRDRPDLLSIAYSASSMWTANAATVSPSADCRDGRVHLTPANLCSMPHRKLEVEQTTSILRQIFHDEMHFIVHDPLPHQSDLSDEGAANHTRFCKSHGQPGIEFFVYGRSVRNAVQPTNFVARQTEEASRAIAKQHLLDLERCVFAQQSPDAIDAGVFHNDVIAVGNQNVHLVHEAAFLNQANLVDQLQSCFAPSLITIMISQKELSLTEAVRTYFFNSQLLTLCEGHMLLLCPIECQESVRARQVIARILAEDNPITECEFVDLRESMQNGGGPACLRLRVVLTEEELAALSKEVFLTDELYAELSAWVTRHYREELSIDDLADPTLEKEVAWALDELSSMLGLYI